MVTVPAGGSHAASRADWRDWHLPLAEGSVTLADGLASLRSLGEQQAAIPLIVQLLENPRYRLPLISVFPGAVDLFQHDCIHLLLGRGLLPLDEAFAIGFTMGSSGRMSMWKIRLFCWLVEHLYPRQYRFGRDGIRVFRDAIRLAQVSGCQPLDQVDYRPLMASTLAQVRDSLRIDSGLLRAYYAIERRRYPARAESQRLLDGPCLRRVTVAGAG